MIRNTVFYLVVFCLWGCASQPATLAHRPSVRLSGGEKAGEKATVSLEGNRTIVDVRSAKGIGRAELTCPEGKWRRPVIIRLHLRGLESFSVTNGHRIVHTWVISRAPYTQYCDSSAAGGKTRSLTKESPFWMAARMVNRKDSKSNTVPVDDGYFELTLPDALFDKCPETLSFQWIDFFRG